MATQTSPLIGKCDLCGFVAELEEVRRLAEVTVVTSGRFMDRQQTRTERYVVFNRCIDREQCRVNAMVASKGIATGEKEAPGR